MTDPPPEGREAGPPEEERPESPSSTRRGRRRRAERSGTNPSAEDLPDVVAPRDDPGPGESQHDRWLREQRPPHWE